MRTRVLALPRYGNQGASSRLRTLQYLPALEAEGIDVEVHSLLDDEYLFGLYGGRFSRSRVFRAYTSRIAQMLGSRRFDVVWTEKELLPWLPSALERAIVPGRTPLLVDYDDAVFHRYDQHRSPLIRTVLGKKIDSVMRQADLVTAGNKYLGNHARHAGARRVEYLPTVIDVDRYVPTVAHKGSGVVIGWIGSPTTAKYLHMLTPALERLQDSAHVRCVAIGAGADQVAGTPFEPVEWSEAAEVELLGQLDIGLMPLHDEPWDLGKCGYKLIQYMGARLPVVASAVGANLEIVQHGVNGFLAEDVDDWVIALDQLVSDGDLRRRMGRAGRRRVEETYSLQVQAPRLGAMIRELAAGRRRS